MSARMPGRRWRVLAHEKGERVELRSRGEFDELVLESWFHLEKMNARSYWMSVADLIINVACRADGSVLLTVRDDHRNGTGVEFSEVRYPNERTWWGGEVVGKKVRTRRARPK